MDSHCCTWTCSQALSAKEPTCMFALPQTHDAPPNCKHQRRGNPHHHMSGAGRVWKNCVQHITECSAVHAMRTSLRGRIPCTQKDSQPRLQTSLGASGVWHIAFGQTGKKSRNASPPMEHCGTQKVVHLGAALRASRSASSFLSSK